MNMPNQRVMQMQENESQHQDEEPPTMDDQSPANQLNIFLGSMVRFCVDTKKG